MQEPMVSIDCITFKQEKYIRDCLNGLVRQKMSQPFEVLIHDDASPDDTAVIISEYQAAYPALIKPILEKENRHSKGISVSTFNWNRARGKYIVMCEGDDYWTDPDKLQKQFEFMESHPEYSACCHNVLVKDESNGGQMVPYNTYFGPLPDHDCDLSLKDIIANGGMYIPTLSLFFRADCLKGFDEFSRGCPVGDYPLQIWLGKQGKFRYMNDVMGVYRRNAKGSHSEKIQQDQQVNLAIYRKQVLWFDRVRQQYNLPQKEMLNMQRWFEIQVLTGENRYRENIVSYITKDSAGRHYFLHYCSLTGKVYILMKLLHIDPFKIKKLVYSLFQKSS